MRSPRRFAGALTAGLLAAGLLVIPVAPAAAVTPAATGQESGPAPAPRDKRVIGAVHTDAVSAYVARDGTLELGAAADIDVDGDGRVDKASRLPAGETLFHVVDQARVTVPDSSSFAFLGKPGQTVWMAPQTQADGIIWPGFSTEHSSLAGKVSKLDIRLTEVDGPGDVEIFLQNTLAPERVFSSTDRLPAWSMGVPQHTHMNWAFEKAGRYTLTFRATAAVGGTTQTVENDYTFVVGDLADSVSTTTVTLKASPTSVPAGGQTVLTAKVAPDDAAGAVEFVNRTTGLVLGHTPVVDGRAGFTAKGLLPGLHDVVAEFVPTFGNEAKRSVSKPTRLRVAGEVATRPDRADTTAPATSAIAAVKPGTAVTLAERSELQPGDRVTAKVAAAAHRGEWLSVWIPTAAKPWQGWVQADGSGRFGVQLPADLESGDHRLLVEDAENTFLGWDRFSIAKPQQPDDGAPVSPDPGPAPGAGPGSDADPGADTPSGGAPEGGEQTPGAPEGPAEPGGEASTPPAVAPAPVPAPAPEPAVAPVQRCEPDVVLDRGHVDAFAVSAAGGRAVLQLKEDVTGLHVIRDPESVLLKVGEQAYQPSLPAGWPAPSSGYVLPLSQRSDLVWPGWDTNGTAQSGFDDVRIHISGVDGPGSVNLYTSGSFGGVESLLDSGGYRLPGVIHVPEPAHTHAQWHFSDAGVYRLTAHAVLTNADTGATLSTSSRTYTFQVGDVPLGDAFCGVAPVAGTGTDAEVVAQALAESEAAAVAEEEARVVEEARAAEQAAAAEEAEATAEIGERRNAATAEPDVSDATADPTPAAARAGDSTLVIGLAVGGGVLLLAAVGGGTAWYLRRLRVRG